MTDFYDRVTAQLRCATAAEKAEIRAELAEHVQDHAEALEEAGCSPEEARERALAAMGDPEEIGRGLARCYTRFWLVLSRLATAGIVLATLSLLLGMSSHGLRVFLDNSTARLTPEYAGFAQKIPEHALVTPLDIRAEAGSDILYIYKVALDPEEGMATVYYCNYDKSPFGKASTVLHNYVEILSGTGERGNGGGGGNSGAVFWWENVPVEPGTDHLRLEYHRFGVDVSLEIPLDWGEDG